jgi:hypothetical protein
MGRVDPGTARVTAVTPLEELDTAVTTLAVGAGGRVGRRGATSQPGAQGRGGPDRPTQRPPRRGLHPGQGHRGAAGGRPGLVVVCGLGGPPAAAARPLPDVTNPTKEARLPPSFLNSAIPLVLAARCPLEAAATRFSETGQQLRARARLAIPPVRAGDDRRPTIRKGPHTTRLPLRH